jgi:hypothetical protein
MEIFNKYKVVIMVVLPVVILVIIRSLGANHFKPDAKKWAEPSVIGSNLVTVRQLDSLSGEKLVINLNNRENADKYRKGNVLTINTDSILAKNNLRIIHKHNGPVLLYSADPAISARIWMVLSQMGISKIYILTEDPDNESFKSKFRSDTLVRPEF